MSALLNVPGLRAQSSSTLARTILRPLMAQPGAKRRPRVFYATVTVAVVAAIIIAQIVLSVSVSSGAYEIATLQKTSKDLSRTYTAVSQQLAEVSSPQHVAAQAESYGMVSSNSPAYLRLADGKILGAPHAASRQGALLRGAHASLVQNILLTDIPAGSVPAAAAQAVKMQQVGVATGTAGASNVALSGGSLQTMPSPHTR